VLIKGVIRRFRHEEAGTSLIELLVAMVTGMIVVAALFAILEVSLHQTSRSVDVVEATQLGRNTMTHVVDELHSACIATAREEYWPVREKSSANELRFVTAASKEAEIGSAASAEVAEHRIVYEPKAKTLTDFVYPSSGGTRPKFTFVSKPASTIRIGFPIAQSETVSKEKVPIFQYEKYATEASGSSTTAVDTLVTFLKAPATETLTAAQAQETAAVLVSFRAQPTDESEKLNRSLDLSAQTTFAFAAPLSETKIKAAPCE
jgi:Tfp pilus assembly protein PilW